MDDKNTAHVAECAPEAEQARPATDAQVDDATYTGGRSLFARLVVFLAIFAAAFFVIAIVGGLIASFVS